MTDTDMQSKLIEYEGVIRLLTAKVEELVAENERLRSAEGAHDVLRRLYLDETQSSNVRVLAARAALGVESAPLKSVEAPLDLTATVEVEPLSVIVERQRARANRMLAMSLEERAALIPGINSGKGDDSSSD